MAKRKIKSTVKTEAQPVPQDLVELLVEVETIAHDLKTSTVSFHKEQLLSLATRLREKLGAIKS